MLSTAFTCVGYAFYNNQHYISTDFTYKGFIPVINLNAGYGGIPTVVQPQGTENIPSPLGTNEYYKFNIYLPINLTRGNFITFIQPHFQLNREKTYYYNSRLNDYTNQVVFTQYSFSLYNYRRTLARDLYPRWGTILKYHKTFTPFENNLIGNIEVFQAKFYLPGFACHHSFQLSGTYEKQKADQYYFNSTTEFVRGYSITPTNEWLNKASVDYAFPVAYPDFNLGRILYLKRISAKLFYDFVQYKPNNSSRINTVKSSGIEILNTIHIAHIIFPFEIGGRYSYLIDEGLNNLEFLIRVDTDIF